MIKGVNMANYIVQEIQTNSENVTALLPPEVRATYGEAASLFYQKCGYAVISTVPIHTVVTYTDEGYVVPELRQSFKHPVAETTE